MAQIKARHVPENVGNCCGDGTIIHTFIVINLGGCFLFVDPVYDRLTYFKLF